MKKVETVKIGLVTIGQSPREDIVSEMRLILGNTIEIIQAGALDGLAPKEIERLRPNESEIPLFTRLNDGAPVIIGKNNIVPFLNQAIARLEQHEVTLIGLLCTEEFTGLTPHRLLVASKTILHNTVNKFHQNRTVAIIYPLEIQTKSMQKKWAPLGVQLLFIPFNPLDQEAEFDVLLARCESPDISIIVLDCFGYSAGLAWDILFLTGKPVLLPRTILAYYLKLLVVNYNKKCDT
ncbi:MAG: AroM family protein [bacterium]|nr:AroM family protein [bacterium]